MDLLETLAKSPVDIFTLSRDESTLDKINALTKSLLDPIAKDHSVLDEIYTEGLDSTQVFGQAQMILSGVGESLLFNELPKLKETFGTANSEDHSEAEESEDEANEPSDEESDDEEQDGNEKGPASDDEAFYSAEEPDVEAGTGVQDTSDEEGSVSDAESEDTKVPSDTEEPVKDAFGLNDGFFDIDEFNKQIVALEDDDDNDEEIDLYADLSDEEDSEAEMDHYDDFFDKPGQKKGKKEKKIDTQEESDEELLDRELADNEHEQAVDSAMLDLFADDFEEEEQKSQSKNLSSFEKQQQKLQAEIAGLEAELIAEKKWTMKGEVKSSDRPVDSLLNDDEAPSLEFDRTSKPVPVITDEVTETIEDLIKRRIKNDEFDDLPKRLITDVGRFVQKQKTEVSDQKSAKSLAEIYEDEYHGVDPEEKISEATEAAHTEITELFTSLNYKLDSLCSAHYIPKPSEFKSIEIKVSDAPASISMEDAQPLHVSDDTKLAPQEVYKIGDDKPKADGARGTSEVQLKSGLSYSKDELSREDKQRLRRAKKRAKSKHFNELKEVKEQREKLKDKDGGDRKRQRVGDVVDTLSKSKNLTVIDSKGELRDASGKLKKASSAPSSSGYRL